MIRLNTWFRSIFATLFLSFMFHDAAGKTLDLPASIDSHLPVIFKVEQIPDLFGVKEQSVYVFSQQKGKIGAIPFQIDHRSEEGGFVFNESRHQLPLDGNDELVFLAKDCGSQIEDPESHFGSSQWIEIKITDNQKLQAQQEQKTKWAYILISPAVKLERSGRDYVHYDPSTDSIETPLLRVRFSKETPMLIEDMQWRNSDGTFGPDILDTMRLIHTGEFLHIFKFRRTQKDYFSEVTDVIDGPIRIIRRTSNNVRIVWQLKAPEVLMDYIFYPSLMFMDTTLYLPFNASWFFSDIKTVSSLDWNKPSSNNPMSIINADLPGSVSIDGEMSAAEESLNGHQRSHLAMTSPMGSLYFTLEIDKKLPIKQVTYYNDDKNDKGPLDNEAGEYGNVGFLTTQWHKLGRGYHHMIFKTVFTRNPDTSYGFRLLDNISLTSP